eukprot:TRINITY_DN10752_c0_g1_i2.p1 TRINITY_DN10752_c0_g1~~TRINITY_DN10752_c0_g1_i2.p1  ORF type:complete len:685 (-),score=85.39 TRINITY_DN10752_c0_g1_i2:632-2686(-)
MGREWRRHALRKCFLFVGDGISSFLGRVWDFRRVVVILGGPGSCLLIARYGEDHLDTVKVFRMGGVLSWMAIWWLTEAVPAPITALLPLALFPVTGILAADTVAKAYWNDIVVLYFGSLVVALCIERWKVHRRLALKLLLSLGSRVTSPRLLLLGFIGCTGILSMFMSNTATSIMMVPMAVAVLHKVRQRNSDGDSFPMHTLTLASQGNLPTHEEKPEPAEAESADDPNTLLHDAVIPLHPEEIPQVHLHPDRVGGGGGTGGIASMMKMNGEGGKESMAAHDPHVVQHAFVALPLTREDDRPDFIQMAEEDLGIGQGAGEGKGDVEGGKVDGEGGDQDECMTPTPGNDSGTEGGFMSFSDKMVKSRLAEMDDPVTQYCRAIVLGIAYSASIGGMGSLTAAGPNLILAGTFSKMFPEAPRISYLSWLAFGFPLAVILLGILWGVLSFIYCPPVTVPLIQAALDRSVLEREYNRLVCGEGILICVCAPFLLVAYAQPRGPILRVGLLLRGPSSSGRRHRQCLLRNPLIYHAVVLGQAVANADGLGDVPHHAVGHRLAAGRRFCSLSRRHLQRTRRVDRRPRQLPPQCARFLHPPRGSAGRLLRHGVHLQQRHSHRAAAPAGRPLALHGPPPAAPHAARHAGVLPRVYAADCDGTKRGGVFHGLSQAAASAASGLLFEYHGNFADHD